MVEEAADFLVLRGPCVEQARLDQHVAGRCVAGVGDDDIEVDRRFVFLDDAARRRELDVEPRPKAGRDDRSRCWPTLQARPWSPLLRLWRRRRLRRHANGSLRPRPHRNGSSAAARNNSRRLLRSRSAQATTARSACPSLGERRRSFETRCRGRHRPSRPSERRTALSAGGSITAAERSRSSRPAGPRSGCGASRRLSRCDARVATSGAGDRVARCGAGTATAGGVSAGELTVPLRLKFSSSRGPIASDAGVGRRRKRILRDRRRVRRTPSASPLPRYKSASLPSFPSRSLPLSRAAS